MKKLLKHWPLALAALLALICAFCLWRLWAAANLLPSQQAAQRWKGGSGRDFAQISCFMPATEQLTPDGLYRFRSDMFQKLKAASYDIENDKGLYLDAWSAFGTAKVSVGRRIGDVQLAAVGGNFFDFHPLHLLSGSYLRPDDVMDDRVLLDKETAWLLFGAVDVAGMSFSLNGMPVVAAGVYEHERDAFSRAAYGDDMRVYMSFSAWRRLLSDDSERSKDDPPVSCYELVMAEPVKGFAYGSATEKFPVRSAMVVENTYRFEPERLLRLIKNASTRSMQTGVVYVPYWENAARAAEDRAALWLLAAIITGVFPIALLLYALIRSAVRGKKKLEDDVLPEARARSRELLREQSRRRWERRHPDEVQTEEK